MVRSFVPAALPPGRKKKAAGPRRLGGPKAAQLEEPADHALGRSQGGFGTKVHLLCDSHGMPLGITVSPGQRHESKFFEATLQRVLLRRRAGRPYWPKKLAADKGYSYPHIRQWLQRHHIKPVIPTRKNQAREPGFDKASYKKRNIIERAIGWFKECRRLATRFEKLAVNYVAFWMVAMIEKLLCRK
jgi:transposase